MQPSVAQAKTLAGLFANDGTVKVSTSPEGFNSPSVLALVESGWLLPTSNVGTWPNGSPYQVHVLGRDGVEALQKFLGALLKRMDELEPAA